MIEYRWQIDEMHHHDIDGQPGTVTFVRGRMIAEEDGAVTEAGFAFTPPPPEPGAPFVPWAELTADQVAAWLDTMPIADDLRDAARAALPDAAPPPPAPPLPWESAE